MATGWTRKELDEVVASIYRATTEHETWRFVIERIGRRLGASIAAVHVHAQPGDVEPATTIGAWSSSRDPSRVCAAGWGFAGSSATFPSASWVALH